MSMPERPKDHLSGGVCLVEAQVSRQFGVASRVGCVVSGEARVVHELVEARSITQRRGITLKPLTRWTSSTSMPWQALWSMALVATATGSSTVPLLAPGIITTGVSLTGGHHGPEQGG